MRRRLAYVATAALLCGTTAGCVSNANKDSGSGGAMATSLTVAYSDGGRTLDPAEANDLTSDTLTIAAYDQLVTFGVKGAAGKEVADTAKYVPMLAKSWTTSPDGKTWTFTLRDDAKFQGGNPVTSADVLYSFDHVKQSASASFQYKLAGITGVTAPDPHTVTVALAAPSPMFLQLMAQYTWSIIDSKTAQQHADKTWLSKNAAGSGPFKIESWDPATEAVFTANDAYWRGKPKLQKVTLKFITEAANRVQLLGKGDTDVAIEIPPKDVAELGKNQNLTMRSDPSNRILYLALDNTKKPFDNPKVRDALAYAVPYDQLISDVMYGQASPLKSALPSGMPGYSDAGFHYTHDLAKAKQLLAEAGYPNGFSFPFTLGSGFSDWNDDAVLLKAELAKIGVTMDIQNMARAQFLDAQAKGSLTAYISKWTSFVNEPAYHLGFLLKSDGTSNYVHYHNPEVDALYQQAVNATDPAAQKAAWAQAQDKITADSPWLYLYQYNRVVGLGSKVAGYVFYPDEIIRFYPLSKKS
jgi:peptide/nickel transport system substrate-binding protein